MQDQAVAVLASTSQDIAGGIIAVIVGGFIITAIVMKVAGNLADAARTPAREWRFPLMIATGAFLVLRLILAALMPDATKAAATAGTVVGVLFVGGLLFG
ncbi:hypothetical protein [Streptomyces sp. NPDC086787]|uniref:hypothetical protein n=1 Tax=Streptomyces sp. NPDC086787 TaxID=3365759 RepID=UPI00380E663B